MAAAISNASQVPLSQPVENEKTGEHLPSEEKNELTMITETHDSTMKHDEGTDVAEIPVIDFSLLGSDRAALVQQIHKAVTEWGFFQILNHGIPSEVLKETYAQGLNFFELPSEIKNRAAVLEDGQPGPYTSDCSTRSFSSLNYAESVAIYIEALDKFIAQVWPDGNQEIRDVVTKFSSGVDLIVEPLFELIAEGLGLPTNYYSQYYPKDRAAIRWHYYPTSPNPTKSLGASEHSDATCLTLLLQDNVGGLQIEKDGQWMGIKPIEDALVVNVGDTLHAWTNGICKSVMHRVVVNREVPRLSFAAFTNVWDVPISAPDELIDESHPRQYKTITPVGYLRFLIQHKSGDKDIGRNGVALLRENFKFEESTDSTEKDNASPMDVVISVF